METLNMQSNCKKKKKKNPKQNKTKQNKQKIQNRLKSIKVQKTKAQKSGKWYLCVMQFLYFFDENPVIFLHLY